MWTLCYKNIKCYRVNILFSHKKANILPTCMEVQRIYELLNACESTLQDHFLIIRNDPKEFLNDKEAATFLKKKNLDSVSDTEVFFQTNTRKSCRWQQY